MSPYLKSLGIDRLSVEERIVLAQEIWDSVATSTEPLPPTDERRAELSNRLAAAQILPNDVVSWDAIKREATERFSPTIWWDRAD
jgi:putative addiction module component (TIGR02574 family)